MIWLFLLTFFAKPAGAAKERKVMADEIKPTDGAKELTIDSLFDEAMKPASHQEDEHVEAKETPEAKPEDKLETEVEKPDDLNRVQEYTDDEFKSINFDKIDPNRVPEKFRQSYDFAVEKAKNLEKAYNEKYMSLAEQRRQFEQSIQERSNVNPNDDPKAWLIQQFEKNPSGVVSELDNEIINRRNNLEMLKIDVMTNPYAEDIDQKRASLIQGQQDINKLESHRRGLDQYVSQKNASQQQMRQFQEAETKIATEVIDEIRKGFPEFDKKRDDITKFATEKLGYSKEQLFILTNPVRIALSNRIPIEDAKKMATANYNAVFKLYNYDQMMDKGKNKIKQGVPSPLAKAGANTEKSSDIDTFDELDKYLTSKGV